MHVLLEKLLTKRGIKESTDISEEKLPGQQSELEVFKEWDKILSRDEKISVENIKEFCEKRINEIQKNIRNPEGKDLEKLALMFDVFSSFIEAIDAPKSERERLELYIKSLIDKS